MATTRSFQDLLNDYLPNTMLMEEYVKRDWFLQNIEVDNSWKGGRIKVPYKGAGASSVSFGALTAANDIAEYQYPVGTIDAYVEVWGSLIWNHRDIMDHEGKIPENTFLKMLPGQVEDFADYIKQVVSCQLANGSHFAKFMTDGQAGGTFEVDHIDRFMIGQKIEIDDDNSASGSYYVIGIDVNTATVGTGTITVSATRGGAAANVSAYTTAQNAKCYHPGVLTNGSFNSIRSALLSSANGGSATLHGLTKTAWPILQAVNSGATFGASITASNILDKLFDFYTSVRQKAKGNANTIVMSFKHLGSVMKLLETQKGPFVVTKQPNASIYGWTEIEITSVKGTLKLVGIVEMDDDVIFFLDMKAMVFRTRGGFKKRMSPDGKEYFEVRATTGFQYIVDTCIFGELEVNKPGHCGIIHGISY